MRSWIKIVSRTKSIVRLQRDLPGEDAGCVAPHGAAGFIQLGHTVLETRSWPRYRVHRQAFLDRRAAPFCLVYKAEIDAPWPFVLALRFVERIRARRFVHSYEIPGG
jgi:hypothetical protein